MTSHTDSDRRFFSPKECARAWGVSTKTVYRMLRAGELNARKVRGQWRIPRRAVESTSNAAAQEATAV